MRASKATVSELIDALIGMQALHAGRIEIFGENIAPTGVFGLGGKNGMAYVPQDRHVEGLLLTALLWENAALGYQTRAPFSKGMWIDRAGSRTRTDEIREAFDVRSPNAEVSAHALSGGNQQKLIIGREMTSDPKFLIAAHPTRGIDVGAQSDVWGKLRDARANGLATMLISADLDELIGLSDTIMVMFHGQLVATLDPAEVTPRELGKYMTGAASMSDSTTVPTEVQA
ncbi:MAG: ATP-binding cassette domain-containing protein [Acidimicrobiales bacterium]